jgi:hypothetical protein
VPDAKDMVTYRVSPIFFLKEFAVWVSIFEEASNWVLNLERQSNWVLNFEISRRRGGAEASTWGHHPSTFTMIRVGQGGFPLTLTTN